MTDIPPGSTVLVTGANGYIASTIVQTFISAGYNVVGAVRSLSRSAWLTNTFPADRLSLIELPDFSDPQPYEDAVEKHKPAAFVLTTFAISFTETDPEALVPKAIRDVLTAIEVAARHPDTVKSVVLTGSAWSLYTPRANVKRTLTTETWNEEAVAAAYAPSFEDANKRGVDVLMASKTKVEQAAWAWVRDHNPAFRFNVVQVDSAFGPNVSPKDLGAPSTAGLMKMLYDGQPEKVGFVYAVCAPQWFVDVRDAAALHVACAIKEGVDRERVFGFAGRYSWKEVLGVMREVEPERTFVEAREDEGVDLTEVPNERSVELLRAMGREGWISLEQTVRDTVAGFASVEGPEWSMGTTKV